MFLSPRITPDPLDILWHYATGYMPDFLNKQSGPVGWVRWSHRGVQYLDRFVLKQKRYVMAPQFELRFDTAFEEVVRSCADARRAVIREGPCETWLTDDLIAGLLRLHNLGYAHSYETWTHGKLVGGTFGIHLGGYVSMMSLFNHVSNAGKAAVGRGMMHLRDRGFKMVDIGMVPTHNVNFGGEWTPRWKFEAELAGLVHQKVSLTDDRPCPPVPWPIRVGMPVVRTLRAVRRRLPGHAA